MERPIAYDKLAREDRFVRMRARDVAKLKMDQGFPPFPDLSTRDSIKERVHGIMVGEMQAMEGAGRTVCDFPETPWEFTLDMARQVWDESRHVEIYLRLLAHLDGYAGEFPETTILWRCACAADAAARVAGVNRGLEGLACDVFNQLVHIARKIGDPILERAVEFVLADEITHVRMGSKWLTKLTEGDRVPGEHRRALQPRRDPARRRPRGRVHLDRHGRQADGGLHRGGDRAPDQDDPALAGLLRLRESPARRPLPGRPFRPAPPQLSLRGRAEHARPRRLDRPHAGAAREALAGPPRVGPGPARRRARPAPPRAARPGPGLRAGQPRGRRLHGRARGTRAARADGQI